MPATPVLAGQQRARADQTSVSNPAAWQFPSGGRGREGRAWLFSRYTARRAGYLPALSAVSRFS